jgi:hypothetical protein
MESRSAALSLYRTLLKMARKFSNYNFRSHAIRKIKHDFRMNQSLSDNVQIAHKLQDGSRQLEVLRRQTLLYQLYPEEASVMENRT